MRIAVVGCVHGQLNRAYAAIAAARAEPDLVIMCGDFQACRTPADLASMSVPARYREMGDFHEYYTGARAAPYLTLVVGGNHEASAHMLPLCDGGGWLAPNVWYLGDVGVVEVAGVRIGGLSGIYYEPHYDLPRTEPGAFAADAAAACASEALYSAYHTRRAAVDRAARLGRTVDVFVTHDWPRGIERFGDLDALLREKPWLRRDVERGRLGSPATRPLLDRLRPQWWLCAHLHVRFEARYGATRFLALDKVLPRRQFLEFIDVAPRRRAAARDAPPDAPQATLLAYTPPPRATLREPFNRNLREPKGA